MLWPEDMPQHALVCLSHNDDLVPSAMVRKHISGAWQSCCDVRDVTVMCVAIVHDTSQVRAIP